MCLIFIPQLLSIIRASIASPVLMIGIDTQDHLRVIYFIPCKYKFKSKVQNVLNIQYFRSVLCTMTASKVDLCNCFLKKLHCEKIFILHFEIYLSYLINIWIFLVSGWSLLYVAIFEYIFIYNKHLEGAYFFVFEVLCLKRQLEGMSLDNFNIILLDQGPKCKYILKWGMIPQKIT